MSAYKTTLKLNTTIKKLKSLLADFPVQKSGVSLKSMVLD